MVIIIILHVSEVNFCIILGAVDNSSEFVVQP